MCEVSDPDAVQGAMTDGLMEVIRVRYKLLLTDGVHAEPDQSLSIGRVSSKGSNPGLVGKISAHPITLRKVTSESTDSSCIMAWVSN